MPTPNTVSDFGACSSAPTGARQRRNVPGVNLVRMPGGPAYDCHQPESFTRTSASVRSFTQFRIRVGWRSGMDCTCPPCGGQASLARFGTARLGTERRKTLGVRRKQCLLVKPSGFVHTPGPPTNKPPRGRLIGWRRGWDSNPRAGKTRPSDFESAPLWPLRYLSGSRGILTVLWATNGHGSFVD